MRPQIEPSSMPKLGPASAVTPPKRTCTSSTLRSIASSLIWLRAGSSLPAVVVPPGPGLNHLPDLLHACRMTADARLRISELLVCMSLVADVGMGLEPGEAARACLIAARLADEVDAPDTSAVY